MHRRGRDSLAGTRRPTANKEGGNFGLAQRFQTVGSSVTPKAASHPSYPDAPCRLLKFESTATFASKCSYVFELLWRFILTLPFSFSTFFFNLSIKKFDVLRLSVELDMIDAPAQVINNGSPDLYAVHLPDNRLQTRSVTSIFWCIVERMYTAGLRSVISRFTWF